MEAIKGIRLLAAFLLLLTGIIHLAPISISTEMEIAITAIFRLLYVIIGLVFLGKRFFDYSELAIPLVGAFLGAYSYLVMKPEIITLFLISIDVPVIMDCCYLSLRKNQ